MQGMTAIPAMQIAFFPELVLINFGFSSENEQGSSTRHKV